MQLPVLRLDNKIIECVKSTIYFAMIHSHLNCGIEYANT